MQPASPTSWRNAVDRAPGKRQQSPLPASASDAAGEEFLSQLLPPQHQCLHFLWSTLTDDEQKQLEQLTRKLLARLDQMEITEQLS